MMSRKFPEILIPPSINDERSRSILKLFEFAANKFDFKTLLMRTGDEILDEALPLAIHDLSLDEFIPDEGLPPRIVRRMIDTSWKLHAQIGTDAGVHLGMSVLGAKVRITHWYQETPKAYHDTQKVTVHVNENIYPDNPDFINPSVIAAVERMNDATKRWSQDTSLKVGLDVKSSIRIGMVAAAKAFSRANSRIVVPDSGISGLGITTCGTAIQVYRNHSKIDRPNKGFGGFLIASAGTAMQASRSHGRVAFS